MRIDDQLAAWQRAGLIDESTAVKVAAYEAGRRTAAASGGGITLGEVVAYAGSVVLLVGVSLLYGTEYSLLGTGGRLALIGLVVLGSLSVGALVERSGAGGAARRARAAGWAVGALAVAAWFGEAFVDWHVLVGPSPDGDGSGDPSGAVMLAAAIGFVVALALLRHARAWLVALAAAVLGYLLAVAVATYVHVEGPWPTELVWLIPGAALVVVAEALTGPEEGRWATEALRFLAVGPPGVAALVLSQDDVTLELFAGLLGLAPLGAAVLRGSPGFALAGGVGLFAVVNEVGFRHFAASVGFPIVLIMSGIALLALAAALFRIVPRLMPRAPAASGDDPADRK